MLKYIATECIETHITFKGMNMNQLMKLFSDAAHLQHLDALSHYSILLIFGNLITAARSATIAKQTLSPAESKEYSTAEAVTYAIWVTDFLIQSRSLQYAQVHRYRMH